MKSLPLAVIAMLLALPGCRKDAPDPQPGPRTGYVHVENTPSGFQLIRGGAPYVVKGAGMQTGVGYAETLGEDFRQGMDLLAQCGGNSLRTWSHANAQALLDYAQTKGLTVMLGLWVVPQRQGMNYDDAAAVAAQLEGFRTVVRTYRNHPALLAWGVGNEVELEATNPKVWPAINEIARMIHQEDPDHPAVYVTATYDAAVLSSLLTHLRDIDILGVNAYAEIGPCLASYQASAWDRPLLVCEWGPTGWWQNPTTTWGAYPEPVGAVRAQEYATRYEVIAQHRDRVLGSYAFYWGQKQERTRTWFSLVLRGGLLTEAARVLQEKWTGQVPVNRAPHVTGISLQGKLANESIQVSAGQSLGAELAVTDPEGDALTFVWQVFDETTATSIGGDAEAVPPEVTGLDITPSGTSVAFQAPPESGAYRLFVQALDGHGNVGVANIPFRVP